MTYHFFLATPEKVIFDSQVYSLIAPGEEGYFEVLPNHAPLITTLKPGRLEVVDQEKKKWVWAVSGGFFEVVKNEAALLADAVELPTEIDPARAEAASKRAKERMASNDPEVDKEQAQRALSRAENRIKQSK